MGTVTVFVFKTKVRDFALVLQICRKEIFQPN